jgi:hypothetical protein
MMTVDQGIWLEFSDGRSRATSLAEVNRALSEIGSRVSVLDLSAVPGAIMRLLAQATLTEPEAERVKAYFLLARERLLEVIAAAGRPPNVPGGGELTTFDATHDYAYPQLWVTQGDADYSRFDRFHANRADDGVGVDEVAQFLAGSGLVVQHRLPGGAVLTLRLDCPTTDKGWLVTYDGGKPHIGSFREAAPGTKVLVQVIGPPVWRMLYED